MHPSFQIGVCRTRKARRKKSRSHPRMRLSLRRRMSKCLKGWPSTKTSSVKSFQSWSSIRFLNGHIMSTKWSRNAQKSQTYILIAEVNDTLLLLNYRRCCTLPSKNLKLGNSPLISTRYSPKSWTCFLQASSTRNLTSQSCSASITSRTNHCSLMEKRPIWRVVPIRNKLKAPWSWR